MPYASSKEIAQVIKKVTIDKEVCREHSFRISVQSHTLKPTIADTLSMCRNLTFLHRSSLHCAKSSVTVSAMTPRGVPQLLRCVGQSGPSSRSQADRQHSPVEFTTCLRACMARVLSADTKSNFGGDLHAHAINIAGGCLIG